MFRKVVKLDLVHALAQNPASVSAQDIDAYKIQVGWGDCGEAFKYNLRRGLCRELKARGVPHERRQQAKAVLHMHLPVAPAMQEAYAQKKAKKQHAQASLLEMQTQFKQMAHRLAAAQEQVDAIQGMRQHWEQNSGLFDQAKAALQDEKEQLEVARTEFEQTRSALQPVQADALGRVHIQVGDTVFDVDRQRIAQHEGLLKAVFCGGLASVDAKNVYHCGLPISAESMKYVVQFYNDELPGRFSSIDSVKLQHIARQLHLDDMVEYVALRTQDVGSELLTSFSQSVQSHLTRLEESHAAHLALLTDTVTQALSPRRWRITYWKASDCNNLAAGWEPIGCTPCTVDNEPVILVRFPA